MIIKSDKPFPAGYTSIMTADGSYSDWMLDFGILILNSGHDYISEDSAKERAFLLLSGEVTFHWDDGGNAKTAKVCRKSVLDENPVVLHVCRGCSVKIESGKDGSELAIAGVNNAKEFDPKLWDPKEYSADRFGEGTLQDTSTRLVRTFFDASTADYSEMVLGEVVNYPGKWSSYPPHDHPQPEVYHYRFFPKNGYGHAESEDEVFKVKNCDTNAIVPGVTHSQCSAPGYAMYYIWIIPHLPNDKFGPDSREFRKEHTWVMDPKAEIWPDAPFEKVIERRD